MALQILLIFLLCARNMVSTFPVPQASTSHSVPTVNLGYATNSNANYNGTDVIVNSDHGLVLVNFNYRVGAFGFLTSEMVRRNGDLNVGLLDQRKALE